MKRHQNPGFSRAIASAALLLAFSGGRSEAADPPLSGWALTNVAQVNQVLSDPTQTNALRARFTGVVIYADRSQTCVQEGAAGAIIQWPARMPIPHLGDRLQVSALVRFVSIDPLVGIVAPDAVENLGPGVLPKPATPKAPETLFGKLHARWVEVEGVVMQAQIEDGVQLHVTDSTGWTVATIMNWPSAWAPTYSWGARVRLRGAVIGRGQTAFRMISPEQITVITPGLAELFAAPLLAGDALKALSSPTPERRRVRATVVGRHDEFLYLRSGDVAFRANLLAPWLPAAADPLRLELIAPLPPDLSPGDAVDVVGSPLRVDPYIALSFCSLRKLGSNTPVEAQSVPAANVAAGLSANASVRTQGVLRSRSQEHEGDRFLETLELEADGVAFFATLGSRRGGELAGVPVGDLLEMSGIVTPTDSKPAYVLALPSRASLRSLGVAPSTTRERNLRWAVIVLGVAGIAGIWIAWLGRNLRRVRELAAERARAEAAVRELNVTLERRVQERTAALASANERLNAEAAEREKARVEISRALSVERDMNELKTRFVSMVSHEFRTPLGITMSAVELLRHHLPLLDDAKRQELFNDIFASTRHMAGLMEQVLLLGRVEAGKLAYRPAPLDLTAVCERLIDESHSATSRRCPIRMAPPGHLGEACADESLLRHIFSNLFSNAVKYSAAGEPVDFSVRREGSNAVFTVRDSGIGIPEADLPKLFQAFHRAGNVGDTAGTGLGLVIVKRCVDLHNGRLEIRSAPGQGTTFTVVLPVF
ncbi:MAG: HAMP domain-containing histidine kinase [Verrucomicrobia bacterium]|nr:HAMP domain-containing histidine kinase [Verrucomicrobiota bacterium]